jgi:hypothetical protein
VHAQTIKIAVAWASRVPNQHVQHAAKVRRCARSAHYCNDIIADNLLLITNTSDHALVVIYHTAFDHHQLMMLAVVPMYEHLCVDNVGSGTSLVRMSAANNDLFNNHE